MKFWQQAEHQQDRTKMASRQKHQDLRIIYDLLDKLSREFSPNNHKQVLKTVTTNLAGSQQEFLSNLSFDESLIVTKIKSHLASKSETNLSVFLNLHEELSTISTPKFRSSILTLLLYLSDMETQLPHSNNNAHLADSVFTLPVRNRSIESSVSMEQINKAATLRVSSVKLLCNIKADK